ncbi:MAG TPA: hypothetical protein VFQ85_04235, partial [Mycobacteriales bacterium]|nr:hypothetical protein [Mycobacteriales bacterium]
MTDVVLDPHRCPDCRAALTGGRTCPGCGLLVTGPVAARLWDVTVQLVRLRGERERLLTLLRPGGAATAPEAAGERAVPPQLATRAAAAPAAPAAATPAADPDAAWAAAFGETAPAWTAERRETAAPAHRAPAARWAQPRPRREWTPQRVQNLLLAVGALLLVTAAIAFTALAWGRLPIAARGAVMLAVTALSGYAADRVLRRGLTASAEAIALLTVLFGVVDAYAARRANLGGLAGTDGATYWSVASGVLAAGAAGFARLVPTRSVRWASLAGAQLPLAITALRVPDWTFAERGAVLVAQAAGLVYAARWLRGTAVAARACGLANYTAGVS